MSVIIAIVALVVGVVGLGLALVTLILHLTHKRHQISRRIIHVAHTESHKDLPAHQTVNNTGHIMQLYDLKLRELKAGVEEQIRDLTEDTIWAMDRGGTITVTREKGLVVSTHAIGNDPLQVKVGNMAIVSHGYRVYRDPDSLHIKRIELDTTKIRLHYATTTDATAQSKVASVVDWDTTPPFFTGGFNYVPPALHHLLNVDSPGRYKMVSVPAIIPNMIAVYNDTTNTTQAFNLGSKYNSGTVSVTMTNGGTSTFANSVKYDGVLADSVQHLHTLLVGSTVAGTTNGNWQVSNKNTVSCYFQNTVTYTLNTSGK